VPAALVPDATVDRLQLDDASWVDVVRGLVTDADEAHAALLANVRWSGSTLFRYDHQVAEPRLGGWWRTTDPPPHAVVVDVHRWLQERYQVRFDGCGLAQYRDGRDGQAFHRDRDMRWLDDTLIGILTLGGQRPWYLRPRANRYDHEADAKGATHDLQPASGDLLVMGGACQARWEHSVPQLRGRPVANRISLQWRWTSKTGQPVVGASYRAPRTYSRR
jgi:alkylated DNA repair dioxygenase AlkB